jgi:hypothetical protein
MTDWPTVSLEQRSVALDRAVSIAALSGGRMVTRGQTEAVMEFGQKPNHVLHAILSIFTCGLWLFVWLVLAAGNRVTRETLTVDEYGRSWISNSGEWKAV